MNHDRQIQLTGDFQLGLEDPPLVLPGREIIMKIQSRLADGDDFFASGKLFELGHSLSRDVFGFVRMNPDRGVHILESVRKLDGLSVMLRVGSDGYPPGYTRGDAALYHGIDIPAQLLERQMTMCINQFHVFYGTKAFS